MNLTGVARGLSAVLTGTALALAGCSATVTPSAPAAPSALVGAVIPQPEPTGLIARTANLADPAATGTLAGKLIVIDPGHNGVWTKKLRRLVPAGNGRRKACNSSGTATNAGYPEHAYNWAQANALAQELRGRGAEVLLTRSNDHSQGPCVNLRSTLANQRRADLLISLHADGSFARGARGFHVIISTTMAGGSAVEAASRSLAKELRSTIRQQTAMPISTYIGRGTALSPRTDIATLNLSERVGVMLEMGNMRNAKDAALLRSAAFRERAATAIADGIAAQLG